MARWVNNGSIELLSIMVSLCTARLNFCNCTENSYVVWPKLHVQIIIWALDNFWGQEPTLSGREILRHFKTKREI